MISLGTDGTGLTTQDTHPGSYAPRDCGEHSGCTHTTPTPAPWHRLESYLQGRKTRICESKAISRMRKTHVLREAGKGVMCLGERQGKTVSGDGAGRTADSGLRWGRVAAEGLGQAGCQASLAEPGTPQQQSPQLSVHEKCGCIWYTCGSVHLHLCAVCRCSFIRDQSLGG